MPGEEQLEMTEMGRKILTETDPIRLNALAYACGVSGPNTEAVDIVAKAAAFDTFLRAGVSNG
tara:strand:+ start:337 stop:525 length:189 start_codon:yes stop_codon:yes gene_type:complete